MQHYCLKPQLIADSEHSMIWSVKQKSSVILCIGTHQNEDKS